MERSRQTLKWTREVDVLQWTENVSLENSPAKRTVCVTQVRHELVREVPVSSRILWLPSKGRITEGAILLKKKKNLEKTPWNS